MGGCGSQRASAESWTPSLFMYHDNMVESRTSQANVPAQDSQGANPPQPHHMVTRSGRIVRLPDYYGVNGNT